MAAGSLNDLLHKQGVKLSLPQTIHIATDVAMGCHYLHKQKPMIIHRDLKSQNVSYILYRARDGKNVRYILYRARDWKNVRYILYRARART